MIIILNLNPKTYITKTSVDRIVASIVAQADPRFIVEQPQARVLNVDLYPTPAETVEKIPLTPGQWAHFAVVPFVPPGTPGGAELLRLINARRGYSSPVVVPV